MYFGRQLQEEIVNTHIVTLRCSIIVRDARSWHLRARFCPKTPASRREITEDMPFPQIPSSLPAITKLKTTFNGLLSSQKLFIDCGCRKLLAMQMVQSFLALQQLNRWLGDPVWLKFWQLRTWIHDNLCDLTIKSDTGQHCNSCDVLDITIMYCAWW